MAPLKFLEVPPVQRHNLSYPPKEKRGPEVLHRKVYVALLLVVLIQSCIVNRLLLSDSCITYNFKYLHWPFALPNMFRVWGSPCLSAVKWKNIFAFIFFCPHITACNYLNCFFVIRNLSVDNLSKIFIYWNPIVWFVCYLVIT